MSRFVSPLGHYIALSADKEKCYNIIVQEEEERFFNMTIANAMIRRAASAINSLKFNIGCAASCARVRFETWCFLNCPPLYDIIR